MQYTAIFHGCKNVHFQMKFFNIFLIFAQYIDCGYTLEPPQFYYIKIGCKEVFVTLTCFRDDPSICPFPVFCFAVFKKKKN